MTRKRLRIERGYIRLKGVRIHAFHGVMPQERMVGADFIIVLRVGYPLETATASDDVSDTLDYAQLYQLLRREMAIPSSLLEHVAGRIATAIEKTFPQVTSIDLELTKLNPPMGADCKGASVEIHLINDKSKG